MASSGVDTRNIQRLANRLARFGRRLQDRTAANREISQVAYQFVIRNFDTGGRLVGGWAPLAESTREEKRRIGKEKPLIRSAQLRNSFVPFFDRENAGVRTELFYATFHHEGTSRIPTRRLVQNKEEILKAAIPIYKKFVERQAREEIG